MTGDTKRYVAELSETTASLRNGDTDLDRYYEELLDRLESVDERIHAFVTEPNRRARVECAIAESRRRCERVNTPPPLYGVPVGVKDIFHVDGLPTRAGSELPADALTGTEAAAVTALRDAGAIVLGKTVSTEFAYSPVGPTRNPHDLAHTPGGSSSGSAAAVGAGLCPLALGTQTVGSVIRPAAFCGVVGFKPSAGRISTAGVVPFSRSADQVGMFTQDLVGMELASSVLCRHWTHTERGTKPTVGVPADAYLEQASDDGLDRFTGQLNTLKRAGYEVRRVTLFDDIDRVNELHGAMTVAEAALAHAEWFTRYGDRYHSETAKMIRTGWQTDIETVGTGRSSRDELRQRIESTIRSEGVDVLLSPAAPGPAPEGLEDSGDPVMNLPWTHAGVPALTIPVATTTEGLPVGLQCVAPHGEDESLLSWAKQLAETLR